MHIHHAVNACEIVSPHAFEQLVAIKHAPRIFCQRVQQIKFACRQFHLRVVKTDLACIGIDSEIVETQCPVLWLGASTGGAKRAAATQNGFDARNKFAGTERFGEVIIRADGQANDLVNFFGARGQHQNINVGLLLNSTAHFQPIHTGQHHIENNERGIARARLRKRRDAITRRNDIETFCYQIFTDEVQNRFFVLDNENRRASHLFYLNALCEILYAILT